MNPLWGWSPPNPPGQGPVVYVPLPGAVDGPRQHHDPRCNRPDAPFRMVSSEAALYRVGETHCPKRRLLAVDA